jgi:predicted transcriptional regulator
MMKNSTQVPNIIFDLYLPTLTESELKILLVIIRQTNGWIDRYTGKRKKHDRISCTQFMSKTGLSRRAISNALKNLVSKGLVSITCQNGNMLNQTDDRRGKTSLLYSMNLCKKIPEHVHLTTQTCAECAHNKTNYTKETITKLRMNRPVHVGEIIKQNYII